MGLTELGKRYNTDKTTYHNFTDFYDLYLDNKRESASNVLEVGVFNGASIFMWRDYFKHATIHAVDIYDKSHLFIGMARVKFIISDQKNLRYSPHTFDVIIDDASHIMEDQQITFANLFMAVKNGGVYIIEDLHTSVVDGKELDGSTIRYLFNMPTQLEHMVDDVIIYKKIQENGDVSITSIIKKK